MTYVIQDIFVILFLVRTFDSANI